MGPGICVGGQAFLCANLEHVTPWTLVRSNSRFRRLWLAQLISLGGDFINQVALSALIYRLTGQATMVAALALATNLPVFLASPLAGVVADRHDRVRIMLLCDLVRALLVLGLLLVRDAHTLPLIFVIVALTETLSAFFEPASAAVLPSVVSNEELGPALALSSASWSTMLAVGAACGGLITARLGDQAAFLANSLTFLLSAALIVGLRSAPPKGEAKPLHPWADLLEGFAHVAAQPRLAALLLIKFSFGMGTGVLTLLTILPLQVFHAGEAGVATLFSARGLGALAGPFLAQRFMGISLLAQARLAALGVVVAGFFYGLLAVAPALKLAALWVILAHLGSGLQWVLSTFLLQKCCDDEFRGRVMALDFAGVTAGMAVSSPLFGLAVDHYGPHAAGVVGAILLASFGLLWLMVFGGWKRRWFT